MDDVWSFCNPNTGIAYGVGSDEETAIRQLAKVKQAIGLGWEPGTLGGKGGWTLVLANGCSLTFHRGERLSGNAPIPDVTLTS